MNKRQLLTAHNVFMVHPEKERKSGWIKQIYPGHIHIKIEKKKEKVLDHASMTEIDATPDTRSCQVIEQLIKVV